MTFDHRIFDARGAELFLNLFEESMSSGADAVRRRYLLFFIRGLDPVVQEIPGGQERKPQDHRLSKSAPEALPFPESGNSGRYRYHLLSFNEQETAGIYERAYNEAGYLMESPYLLVRDHPEHARVVHEQAKR